VLIIDTFIMEDTRIRQLEEREAAVLRAVVYEYITTGKPVGSRSFVQKYNFSISPATMRNIMYDLETMEFLKQPHTSAGRIPTDQGYRFYVDSLLDSYDYTSVPDVQVKEEMIKRELQLDRVFSSITRLLSQVSKYSGVMLTPKPDFTVIKRIELIPLDTSDVLVILITRTGLVFNRKVVLSESVTREELSDFSGYLTSELCGYSIIEIRKNLVEELRVRKEPGFDSDRALDILELALKEFDEPELYIDGVENLLRIPEMVESAPLNSLLNIIEDRETLRGILERLMEKEGISTLIGDEIESERVTGCSMVATGYKIGNKRVGVIGILGPTRMDYEKAVPLIDYTGNLVSDFLTQMSK
jgi:heat-inducible transcriptional repressor